MKDYWDEKWEKIIKLMPTGGKYRFDLRKHSYKIIEEYIPKKSTVFDYACGLGVLCKMLESEKDCTTSGCDISKVAIDYIKKRLIDSKGFKTTDIITGNFDYVVSTQYLEHTAEPVNWLNNALDHSKEVICALPNNFRQVGEHKDMQWNSWIAFYELFDDFEIVRLDEEKYQKGLCRAFMMPIFSFKRKTNAKTKKKRISSRSKNRRSVRKKDTERAEDRENARFTPLY